MCQAVRARRVLTAEDFERDRRLELERARHMTSAPEEDDAVTSTTTTTTTTITTTTTAASMALVTCASTDGGCFFATYVLNFILDTVYVQSSD